MSGAARSEIHAFCSCWMSEADDAEGPPYDEKSSRSMSMARCRHEMNASRYSKITINGQSGSEFSKDGMHLKSDIGGQIHDGFIYSGRGK